MDTGTSKTSSSLCTTSLFAGGGGSVDTGTSETSSLCTTSLFAAGGGSVGKITVRSISLPGRNAVPASSLLTISSLLTKVLCSG